MVWFVPFTTLKYELFAVVLILFFKKSVLSLKIEFSRKSLIGAPRWLKIHQQVEFEQNKIYTIMDFIPLNPKSPKTLLNLIIGRDVDGEVRMKMRNENDVLTMLDRDLLTCLKSIQTTYPKKMNLYSNNCYNFTVFAAKFVESNYNN